MMNNFVTGYDEITNRLVDTKIQLGKDYFRDIVKTGKNSYQKFNYLENEVIFPIVRRFCKDHKMLTRFEFTENSGILFITCREDKSTAMFTIQMPTITDSDPNKFMQNVGKCRTYAMRYLYISAFEIAESDSIDAMDQKNMKNKAIKDSSYQGTKNNRNIAIKHSSYQGTKNNRNIQDLSRKIAEEMTSKGIPDTVENVLEYMKQEWKHGHLSPNEYRELKQLVEGRIE